jgi:ATP-dependent DNA helicase RecG
MTEGRGTGIPKMLRAIERNQSPLPEFYTDDDRSYFRVELPLHPAFAEKTGIEADAGQVTAPVTAPVLRLLELLSSNKALANAEILVELGLKNRRRMRETYITPALQAALIEYTIPDKPTSRLQKYRLTEKGRRLLEGGVE